MRYIVPFFLLLFILTDTLSLNAVPLNTQKLNVLSTIKPIHMMVVELADTGVEATQLVPDNASPHDYSFKPSDISKIKNASLIFRIDEHFEAILSPVLEAHSSSNKLISLAESEGIKLLTFKDGEGHKHGDKHSGSENSDFHIWTSPQNAMVMAKTIAMHLIELDPSNKQLYEKNLKVFLSKMLVEIDQEKVKLEALKDKSYVVFNDSWRYFKDYYELKDPIVINRQEGQSGNIRAILKIRKKIASEKISCLFSDSSVNPARIETITEKQTIKSTQLDILAKEIPVKKGSYFKWLKTFNGNIVNCLSH